MVAPSPTRVLASLVGVLLFAVTANADVLCAKRQRDGSLNGPVKIRPACRAGEVTLRAAEAVLPKAKGEDEAVWVERARAGSVRGLKAAVKKGA